MLIQFYYQKVWEFKVYYKWIGDLVYSINRFDTRNYINIHSLPILFFTIDVVYIHDTLLAIKYSNNR